MVLHDDATKRKKKCQTREGFIESFSCSLYKIGFFHFTLNKDWSFTALVNITGFFLLLIIELNFHTNLFLFPPFWCGLCYIHLAERCCSLIEAASWNEVIITIVHGMRRDIWHVTSIIHQTNFIVVVSEWISACCCWQILLWALQHSSLPVYLWPSCNKPISI